MDKGRFEAVRIASEKGEVTIVALRSRLTDLGLLDADSPSQTWLGSVFGTLSMRGTLRAVPGKSITYEVPGRNNHKKTAPVWRLVNGARPLPEDPGEPPAEVAK
jgi:hypothetical protein